MIYVNSETEEWILKHKLEKDVYHCPKCKGQFEIKLPILTKDCAGIASETHECGSGYVGVVLTPRDQKIDTFWKTVLS